MSTEPSAPPTLSAAPIRVEPWPSEGPLLLLVGAASLFIWALIAITIVGLIYAVMLGLFFFFGHLALITYVRGSAVRLSPRQFPELYARVETLARRAGLAEMPEAYVMQADGSLNAFATKFLRRHIVVLHTDLLDACEGDEAARDMIIGHELGHVRAGHLSWHWLLVPGMLMPFVGAAYSRAREYTCDRYGAALCGDPGGALRGLALLAVGRRLAPRLDLQAYTQQREQLETGLMTIGRWLSTYPPLSARIAALQPAPVPVRAGGALKAVAILAAVAIVPIGMTAAVLAAVMIPAFKAAAQAADERAAVEAGPEDPPAVPADPVKSAEVGRHHAMLEALIKEEVAAGRPVAADWDTLAALWQARRPGQVMPSDPYNGGAPYGVLSLGEDELLVYSTGPDGQPGSDDDIDHPVALK